MDQEATRSVPVGSIAGALILLALILGAGIALGRAGATECVRREAVRNNAAHYEADGETGAVRFVWGAEKKED